MQSKILTFIFNFFIETDDGTPQLYIEESTNYALWAYKKDVLLDLTENQ